MSHCDLLVLILNENHDKIHPIPNRNQWSISIISNSIPIYNSKPTFIAWHWLDVIIITSMQQICLGRFIWKQAFFPHKATSPAWSILKIWHYRMLFPLFLSLSISISIYSIYKIGGYFKLWNVTLPTVLKIEGWYLKWALLIWESW